MIQEPIRLGQRIARFTVEAQLNGQWRPIASATTIGHKRLLRVDPVTSSRIRLQILEANNTPAISNIGLFKASPGESKE